MLKRRLKENDPRRLAWDGLIAIVGLITLVMLPLDLLRAYHLGQALPRWWVAFDLIGLIDIALNLITSYERDGIIVRERRQIWRAYARGMGPVDLLANLPPLLIPAIARGGSPLSLLPLLRGVRLLFLANRWEHLNLIDIHLLRISRYGLGILVLTHWLACLWLAVGLVEPGPVGWIARTGMTGASFSQLYETALYWAVALVTVGFGEVLPKTTLELRAAMLMMTSSLLIYTFALANMLTILSHLDGGRADYNERQAMLARFLDFNGVSSATINRVRQFNEFQWSRTRGLRTSELFEGLPAELRSEITVEMMHDALQSVPLLSEAPPPLQKRLLSVLEPVTYPPRTVVLEIDEPGERIVFITRGSVLIESPVPLPPDVCLVDSGDYVGDLSFFLRERRNCRAVADSYVVAFLLNRPVFESLHEEDPRLQSLLRRIAAAQSQRNQALLLAGVVV